MNDRTLIILCIAGIIFSFLLFNILLKPKEYTGIVSHSNPSVQDGQRGYWTYFITQDGKKYRAFLYSECQMGEQIAVDRAVCEEVPS